jgi:hypothetical protein
MTTRQKPHSRTVRGSELAVGDEILFLGQVKRVDYFEPYTGSLLATLGEGTRIARSLDPYGRKDWGMTVEPAALIEVIAR